MKINHFKEFFKISFQSLKRRRLRSWLTMIGIFIGIAAVVSLISLGQGMKASIYDSFQAIGSDKLLIQPKASLGFIGDSIGVAPLTTKDVDFLEHQQGVNAITYYTITSGKIRYQGVTKYYTIAGVPTQPKQLKLMTAVMGTDIATGRLIAPGDKKVATVGFYHTQRDLYNGKNMNLNSKFTINDNYTFRIVGVFSPVGDKADDTMIIIPIDTFREITGISNRVDYIIVQVAQGADPRSISDELNRALAHHRNVKEGKEDFTIQTPEELLASFETILSIIHWVLIGIASISLFVGAIGIMNTMYTSVLERNKDIGIMKAIGAKNSNVFSLFFIESGLLGFAGGVLGVIIGIGLAKLVEIISRMALGKTFLQAHLSLGLVIGSLLLAFVVGAIAGTFPAMQAAKLPPAETLRDE